MHPHGAAFDSLRDRYVRFALERNPSVATFLGGDGWDPGLAGVAARLRDASPSAIAEELAVYREAQRELSGINRTALEPNDRIDAALLEAHLAFVVHQLVDLRYHERAVDTYVSEPFRSVDWQVQQMAPRDGERGTVGTADEWSLLVARVRGIPEYLEVALRNLRRGSRNGNAADARMVERDGVIGSRSNAEYFRSALPDLARVSLATSRDRRRLLDDLVTAGSAAAEAFERFGAALADLPSAAGDRFALGESEWEWRVHNNLRDARSAEEIWQYAAAEVEAYRDRLLGVAREISRRRSLGARFDTLDDQAAAVNAVFAALGAEAPADDRERLVWHIEAGRRAVEYGRRHDLFAVDADYELDVFPTPPLLQGTVEAAYYPAAPLKPGGIGRFYLTPTGDDPVVLAQNPRPSVATVAVHEGFPGHDWHYRTMAAHGPAISALRWLTPGAVEDSSSMWSDSMSIEGWGLYSEDLMHEGGGDAEFGFYSLEEELYFVYWGLRRAMRVRVDTGLHTGRMGYDEAVDWWAANQDFMPDARARSTTDRAARAVLESADRNIYRYTKWATQGITYNLGKRSIIALRDQFVARNPKATPRSFHEWYLGIGTIPAGYLAESLG